MRFTPKKMTSVLAVVWSCGGGLVAQARDWVFRPHIYSGVSYTVSQRPDLAGGTATSSLGGLQIGAGVMTDLGRKTSAGLSYGMGFSHANQQMIRSAIETKWLWNVIGGLPVIAQTSPHGRVYSGFRWQVAPLIHLSLARYNASDSTLTQEMTGSVFEVNTGLFVRQGSYAVEVYRTVLSVSGSSDRLYTSTTSLALLIDLG